MSTTPPSDHVSKQKEGAFRTEFLKKVNDWTLIGEIKYSKQTLIGNKKNLPFFRTPVFFTRCEISIVFLEETWV